jgi:hypothetical protein
MPNPVPPVVTISPDELLSLAIPLTGCPNSQKYLNVCFCTSVSNSSSEITGNLYVESNSVDKLIVNGANNDEPELLISSDDIISRYFVNQSSEEDGEINTTLSLFWK